MKKIFIDVGGNVGQTIGEVLKPTYYFDVIHSLEPQRECYETLCRKFKDHLDGRLVLHNFGLADFDGEKNLYGTGIGASLFADKYDIDSSQSVQCRFVQASKFFNEHICEGDFVVMKLNCEGGEILVLRDLLLNGNIHSLAHILIDFDIRKIPSQRQEEEKIVSELAVVGFRNYIRPKEIRWGFSYRERISSWLSLLADAEEIMELTVWQKIMRRLPFAVRSFICKKIRKIRKMFYKMCGRYHSKITQ